MGNPLTTLHPASAVKTFIDILNRDCREAIGTYTTETIAQYSQCTIPQKRICSGVVKPRNVFEVQQCITRAHTYGVSLYPISRGKNWGYGSCMPVTAGECVVDLSELHAIRMTHETLGYAVIEAGVTQAELYQYLQRTQSRLRLDPSGAGPNASIVGNILERGVGMGRLGDHFGNVIGMEIVLPSGELLRTGILRVAASSSGIDTTQIAPYSWGVGPYLDGIFSQSNFGICTALALRLDPIQEAAEACYCLSPDEDALAAIVEVVRELSFAGVLSGSANIISRNRVIAARMQYPWQETNGKTPLSKDLSRCLGTRFAIPAWTTMLFLEGKCGLVRAQKRELKRSLSNITSEQRFFSERSIRRLEQLDTLLKKLHLPGLKKVASIRSTFDLMKGVPNEMSLRAPYWRNRSVPLPAKDFDPLRDGCGLLWIAPVLPAIGKTVAAFDTWLEAFLNRFGFDNAPNYLSMQQGRTIISTIPLLYDKGTKVECERAESCYHELIAACISHGFPPYRLGVQSLPEFIDKNDPYWKIIDDLKQSLDPDGVLAEGHYAPRGNHLN